MQTLNRILDVVVYPVIRVIFALAILYFVFGVMKYIMSAENPEARQDGARHIMWSLVGMFIMLSIWGIMGIIKATLGA